MKKTLLVLFLAGFGFLASAQKQAVSVSGIIMDITTGLPAAGQMVYISSDSSANVPGYFNIVYSGPDGMYYDEFQLWPGITSGFVSIYTYDCNGEMFYQGIPFGPGNYNVTADFWLCAGNVVPPDCYADFGWWQSDLLTVYFQDFSWPPPSAWTWDFGDGFTSNEQNPVHEYAESGVYPVTLTIFVEDLNCESTTTYEVWVGQNTWDCEAYYYWNPSWMMPLTIEFYDASWFIPGTWHWDFGDGQYAYEPLPVHTYAEPGTYEVTLTIQGADSTCYDHYTELIYVNENPYGCFADFGWYQTGSLSLQFQDFSMPAPAEWFWDFGDNTVSYEQNPVHTYSQPGIYPVCLTISNPEFNCEDTRCYEVWVDTTGYIECFADFWYLENQTLEVQFQDFSWPMPASWIWEFGDGVTSNEQNPVHLYSEAGIYLVTLSIHVEETGCESTTVKEVWVGQNNWDCTAWFSWSPSWQLPLTVEFYDGSWFTPGSWHWDFGDGQYSLEQFPVHTYTQTGTFEVTLTIQGTDSTCYDQYTSLVFVEEYPYGCMADFWWYPTGQFSIQFQDYSTPMPQSWFWDFGDNTTSSEQNPVHTYFQAGIFQVCLTITNPELNCVDTRCYEVWVGEAPPDCASDFFVTQQNELTFSFEGYFLNGLIGQFSWDFGDGTSGFGNSVAHTYSEPGSYMVCLTTITGNNPADTCIFTSCKDISTGNNGGGMQASFIVQQDSISFLTYHFIDTSTGNPYAWYWEFGDGNSSTEQNPVHEYTNPGWYEVCLTIFGQGMTDTWCNEFEMSATALGIGTIENKIIAGEIFPNPNTGKFSFNVIVSESVNLNVTVMNDIGQEVFRRTEKLNPGKSAIIVELNDLAPGIYNLSLIDGKNKLTKKFIIQP